MINKVSIPIISEEWDHIVWLPQKEWSQVASLPYFLVLRPSKFRRSEFGGRGGGERWKLLFDIEQLPIVGCTTFWAVPPRYGYFSFCEDFICTQAFGQQILQLLDLATVLAVPFFLLLCQYALKSVLLSLTPGVGLYLRVCVICGKR